jgi:hypothetical protein
MKTFLKLVTWAAVLYAVGYYWHAKGYVEGRNDGMKYCPEHEAARK